MSSCDLARSKIYELCEIDKLKSQGATHSSSIDTNAMLIVSTVKLGQFLTLFVCVIDAVVKGDGRYIEGKSVIVDRELGRTKKDWMPRRLGGGKGNSRRDVADEEKIRKLKREIEAEVKETGLAIAAQESEKNGKSDIKMEEEPSSVTAIKTEVET